MTNEEKLTLYKTLFRGRTDVYPRRWEKGEKSGWSPAYVFDWDVFNAHRERGGTMQDFEEKTLLPLTDTVLLKHLLGKDTVGIYPILPDNTSYFLAADFDKAEWKQEGRAFEEECTEAGLFPYTEISRSGNGCHVWLFFEEQYPCWKSRTLALTLIRKAYHYSEFAKEVSFDRLFPNQDTVPEHGFGNLIALPLQGEKVAHNTTVFCDDTYTPYENQWEFLKNAHRHTTQELDSAYEASTHKTDTVYVAYDSSVHITLHGTLTLQKRELSSKTTDFIKEELNIFNKEYVVKKKLGKGVFGTERYFNLIQDEGDTITLPRGFLEILQHHFETERIPYTIIEAYKEHDPCTYKSDISIREEQKQVLDTLQGKTHGIIIAPPGSGKTIIALEHVARLGLPTLVLVNRNQLLTQWVERIGQFLGIPKTHIGTISGTRKKIGEHITVATLQSLVRYKNIQELSDLFGVVIVDECHHVPAKTYREVINTFRSKYCFGLTATHERAYDHHTLTELCIGPVITELHTTQSSKETFALQVIYSTLSLPFRYKNDHYEILAKTISYDTARNNLILEAVLAHVVQNHSVLILTERKEHIEVLSLYLRNKTEVLTLSGEDSVRQRKLKHAQLNAGNFTVVIATGQLLGEGFDIQGFDVLVLAFPIAFEGKLKQYIGRLRGSNTKHIIDVHDPDVAFLARQCKKRDVWYEKELGILVKRDSLGF